VRTTGYRLIHGENDGLPGLVLDRYGDTCVLKLYTVAWVAHLAHLLPALVEASGARDLILRLSRAVADHKALLYGLQPGQHLYGPGAQREADEGNVVHFREYGLRFTADVVHGQKTGFFFDHRHNRARVERLARGGEVLNLFAYTGAFSLYAARGGARRVLSQDLSAPALDAAQAHFDLNMGDARVAAAAHQVLQGDAFEALASLHRAGESFDLIVVDPPSFASSMDDVPNALRAYQRLVRGALRLLRSEGMLVMASCTARVTPQQFYDSVLESAEAMGVRLQETARTGHALDHPIGFAEGRYLKCLFARRADDS
jgi:23S rRNA (cytosine1962-C5)-methyltransferase